MKTLIIYYSYSGNTKKIAEELMKKISCDMVEIKDVKRPGKLKAFTAGIIASARGKAWAIQQLGIDISVYDRLILFSPIWAGNPAPAFNAVLERLPEEKSVAVKMVSQSGKSNCKERVESAIKAKNCTLESWENIKA